jgi:outer membrane biosynthesis protein TonB
MSKKYYEKGRLKYFSRNQLIVFDSPTIIAVSISIAFFLFGSLIVFSLKQWTDLLNSKPAVTNINKKKDTEITLNLIDEPAEIIEQLKKLEIPPLTEKIADNKNEPTEEKVAKAEHNPIPQPNPEFKPLPTPKVEPVVKKVEPVVSSEKKPPEPKAVTGSTGSTTMAPDKNSPLALNTATEQAETEEHIFYRKILESMIQEKLTTYKSSFEDKWKTIAGSYIVDIDLSDKGKLEIKVVTTSANFYFNQISDHIIRTIKYPPLKSYNLKSYHQTFIFTYRPYGNQ